MERPGRAELAAVVRRAARPPLGQARFWAIQAAVVAIALVHLEVDLHSSLETGDFPAGVPVALLVLPVAYAALRYGLAGSAATGLWATLLWLPDLLLPNDRGHTAGDLVNLALVDFVAFVIGLRIEAERLAYARAERTTAERLAVEARYRQLFEANSSPTLVLDSDGAVRELNPAAEALFGEDAAGRPWEAVLGGGALLSELPGRVFHLRDGRDYRAGLVDLPASAGPASAQVVLEDVTEEREEGRRAARYAALVVRVEEDQRRRLARELHDEPLQLFLHLARSLGSLAGTPAAGPELSERLDQARRQALDAASRLRAIARDLRPPTLDQLGLVAALRSLVADSEDVELTVVGEAPPRLAPDVELGVFRLVEEAVRNALRHARAQRVRVTLHFGPSGLRAEVADDGCGFDVTLAGRLAADGHLGLVGMTERARLLGGRLEVRSAPGAGTVVEAVVPLGPYDTGAAGYRGH